MNYLDDAGRRWRVVIASTNPVKRQAAAAGFGNMFPGRRLSIEAVGVDSGVSDQPMSDQETLTGARRRVEAIKRRCPDADFWVGIEGGVVDADDELAAFAWVVVRSESKEGRARTGTFILPPPVARLVRDGIELGDADDIVFGQSNSKRRHGAVGLLTGNLIDRTALYQHAVTLALIPFLRPELYPPETVDMRS